MSAAVVTPVRAILSALLVLAFFAPAAQGQTRLRTFSTAMASPQGVTASWASTGVQVAWQGVPEAAMYVIRRGPDATTPGTDIGRVRPDVFTFMDAPQSGTVGYQVVAVAADGRQGASAIVLYSPPATLSTTTLTTSTMLLRTAPIGMTHETAPPVISPFPGLSAPDLLVDAGATVTVSGSGLVSMTSVELADAYKPYTKWVVNTAGSKYPMTATNANGTSFTFVVTAPPHAYTNQYRPYVLIVTKSTGVDTSDGAIHVKQPEPVRKITSVASTNIRAGHRVRITGVGFGDVVGGYFGSGVPGSTANPKLNIWNRTDTNVELETPATCKQSGLLMLEMPRPGGGSPIWITADTNITVHCYTDTPAGTIQGIDAQNRFYANATSTITITGTNLRAVTYAVDQMNRKYPVTYATSGTQEWISFKLGSNFSPGGGLGFTLENVLTDPVVNGTVTGTVVMLTAPTWYRISPSWAEAGQKVRINGHNLVNGGTPQVTVGGLPAQLVSTDPNGLWVDLRVPAGVTSGPIALSNPGGTVQLTGSFLSGIGTQHPGFFIVAGPSNVTSIQKPNATLAAGDTITVTGQNLARLRGICVTPGPSSGMPAGSWLQMPRVDQNMGYATSNTEMKIVAQFGGTYVGSGPFQLLTPTDPPGDYVPTNYACTPNPSGGTFP